MSNINNTSACRTIVILEDDQESSSQATDEVDLELRLGPCNGSANQGRPVNGIEEDLKDPNGPQESDGCESSSQKQPMERDIKLTCSICLDELQEESCTTCGHVFCRPCITMAVVTQGRCPTCRKAVHFRGIRRIYLPKVKS